MHFDHSTVLGNDSLADSEAKAHLVDSPIRLVQIAAKALKQPIKIAAFNAFARVEDVHDQHLGAVMVGHTHPDKAALRKFQGILDQVDQDLLKPYLVTHQ